MLRDVFYFGEKPNVHPREQHVKDIDVARQLSTTLHFWIIDEFCEYANFDWEFDFDFLPDEDVWAEEHNNIWPSKHQKDSGTWLCPKEESQIRVYRADVNPINRKREPNAYWKFLDTVDKKSIDFSWHPDPTDPPYIYKWGSKFAPVELATVLEYHTPGNNGVVKNLNTTISLLPNNDCITVHQPINTDRWDMSWRPDPMDEPYIYVWGNKWISGELEPTLTYTVEGATEHKYMANAIPVLPQDDRWEILTAIDEETFDFSWRPDPREPAFIYVFGNHLYEGSIMPTLRYTMPDATEIKYVYDIKPTLAQKPELFEHLEDIDQTLFDYSWRPNPTAPAYMYAWGNQWNEAQDKVSVQFVVEDATEYQYMEEKTTRKACKDNWIVPTNLDTRAFDFSWEPSPNEPAMIHEFGTQWQKTGGPQYHVEGAVEIKYENASKANILPSDKSNWTVPSNIDADTFDFSWHPDATSPPYVYHFPTQWALSGGPQYHVDGADETKYVEDQVAKAKANKEYWEFDSTILDEGDFDYSWHPYAEDEPFIYQFGTQHQKTGGHKYMTPGTHEGSAVKYIDPRIAKSKRLPDPNNRYWGTLGNYKIKDFDYSWHHDETDEAFVYHFGNKYYSAQEMPTVEYRVPNAVQIKYINSIVAELQPVKEGWTIPADIDDSEFDYSWRPSPLEDQAYVYQFGTQWQKTDGPSYKVEGATDIKYVEGNTAKKKPDQLKWDIPIGIDVDDFDFSWHPDSTETSPFIYQFGTQWALTGGPSYIVKDATEVKYVEEPIAKTLVNMENWEVPTDVDSFDFSWHPYTQDDPFIYQFGTQHQKTDGPRYIVPGATQVKYVDTRIIKARKLANSKRMHWVIPDDCDVDTFDFSWHPDSTASPAIYQFGSVTGKDDGPKYITPGNSGEVLYLQNIKSDGVMPAELEVYFIKTTLEDLIAEHKGEVFWAINIDLVYTDFDFSWRPDVYQSNYIHAFGSKDNIDTQTYFVNAVIWEKGFKNINYIETEAVAIKANLDMFYVDRGNKESKERFEQLQLRYPNIQKTRYLNSWVETTRRCINRSTTTLLWVLNSELDYAEFDFDYYPNPWQMKMVHVFGTQWSHWGTTYLVSRETFNEDTKFIRVIEHLNNLNFVKEIRAKATECVYDVVVVDHGNKETDAVVKQLQEKAPRQRLTTIEHDTDYLVTLKNIIAKLPKRKEHYIWIASSICDYNDFDLSYICDPFARDQLHVFPSDKQKFGDTFFIDVNKTREIIDGMTSLEDYEKINYNQTLRTHRLRPPVIISPGDTHMKTIKDITNFPYAVLVAETDKDIQVVDEEPMSLWSQDKKNIIVTSTGATRIIVPREVKDVVKKELYEYPYIKNANRLALSKPMDIVFLSNGETGAEENWEHLQKITKNLPNRVVRVDGVDGRVKAYHASAEASETPWAFTVFAKLKVSPKFDFNWQPDRMQRQKHYIFEAKNPVTGLVYGHQAMIAYNKELTLSNYGYGLDFTLDDDHASISLLSGIAKYNTDAFSTWRTAFREVIKLLCDDTEISKTRLDTWLNIADPDQPFFQESIKGAICGEEYFEEVDGDFEKLRLSYEWKWLAERYAEVSY